MTASTSVKESSVSPPNPANSSESLLSNIHSHIIIIIFSPYLCSISEPSKSPLKKKSPKKKNNPPQKETTLGELCG